MKIICDYGDLPADRTFEYYIRSNTDPRYLIAGHTGDVYAREDGEPWEFPAWEVSLEYEDDRLTVKNVVRKQRAAKLDSHGQLTSKRKRVA